MADLGLGDSWRLQTQVLMNTLTSHLSINHFHELTIS
uniref:Uncharacterized protein n=1 Tax=Anguilla anguilla TaxID=7936 RepID=A0A0E9RDX2_ANGAN